MDEFLRGVSVSRLFERLAAAEEARLGPASPARYVRDRAWFFRRAAALPATLRGWFGGARRGIPGSPFATPLRALYDRGPSVVAPVHAEQLQIGNHLRAMYPRERLAAKILVRADDVLTGLRNEIDARRQVEKTGELDVPRIVEVALDAPVPHLWEELIFGRQIHGGSDAERSLATLLPKLWRAYAAFGFTRRSRAELEIADDLAECFRDALAKVAWQPRWPERAGFATEACAILSQDRGFVCSFGHGDLGLSNLCLTPDGRVLVFDWERAGEMPVPFDLRKLAKSDGRVAASLARGFAQHVPEAVRRDCFGFSEQILFALANQLVANAPRLVDAEAISDPGERERWRLRAERYVASVTEQAVAVVAAAGAR